MTEPSGTSPGESLEEYWDLYLACESSVRSEALSSCAVSCDCIPPLSFVYLVWCSSNVTLVLGWPRADEYGEDMSSPMCSCVTADCTICDHDDDSVAPDDSSEDSNGPSGMSVCKLEAVEKWYAEMVCGCEWSESVWWLVNIVTVNSSEGCEIVVTVWMSSE